MSGRHGFALPEAWGEGLTASLVDALGTIGLRFETVAIDLESWILVWIAGLLSVVWLMPNTQQLLKLYRPDLGYTDEGKSAMTRRLTWRPNPAWLIVISSATLPCRYQGMGKIATLRN
jgi:hypothetical protein